MPLKPLEQWICDTCGQIIAKPEDGWVEWLTTPDGKAHGFKIVHNYSSSPRQPYSDCLPYGDKYTGEDNTSSSNLTEYVGPRAIPELLHFIDRRLAPDEAYNGPFVTDLGEWAVLLQRLMLPYYEEGRLHIREARKDGNLDTTVGPLEQTDLEDIVDQYSGLDGDSQ